MRFTSLGSGSSGNATVVEARSGLTTTRVLVDCGFSRRELARRLERVGLNISDLDAVFITHEHGDHVGCALTLARRDGVALVTSEGTWQAIDDGLPLDALHIARDGAAIDFRNLCLTPYAVPHDAREPLQLRFDDGAVRMGILTDAGSITDAMVAQLQGCAALLLECNHAPQLLAASAYPPWLKRRIAGPQGHLANETAAALLERCRHTGLNTVVAAHLSERNNSPGQARAALAPVLGCEAGEIGVADPLTGYGWCEVR